MALYLITGGCGFIGSHLASALLARGDRVRVLDDLSTGLRDNLLPGCDLLEGDVADPALVRRAMEGVDGCFHLAAIASVELGLRDWLGTHRVNLGGTITVLDAARAGRVPVAYASSAAVYGEQARMPITEAAVPRPLSSYGADKLGSEQHARVAGAVHGVPSCGLRFFNVFGPRQDPRSPYSGVISIFCGRMAAGEPVTIHGDGRQTRDFVPVAQVVAALLGGMRAASVAAPVFNVCTGRPTSVLDLAQAVAAACGVAPDIRHGPPRAGEIRESFGDPALSERELGLGAAQPLAEGLREVVAWLRAGSPAAGVSR
ncbi:NAD-dependent epimerase/dehydratase family protein [Roseococcus sp. DSY-14]|uniref:NAD-dependent epimerase/dehydratase family protein n=1 Tax=Roseococcus sp. DSY-14 TaxID=3369650 RepID=UPI00387B74DA